MSLDALSVSVAGPGRGPATVPPFDQVTVAVAPGEDLVVRMPGILVVVAVQTVEVRPSVSPRLGGWGPNPVPPPATEPAGDVRVGELLDLCRRVSAAGSRAPGRRLHDELRGWLAGAERLPSFAVAAATDDGLVVVLVGEGRAEVPDLGLRLRAADGDCPLPGGGVFLDRLVDWPPAALRLSAGERMSIAPHPLADLAAGTVPGSAALLSPAPAPSPALQAETPGTTMIRLQVPALPPPAQRGTGRETPSPAAPSARASHAHSDDGQEARGDAGVDVARAPDEPVLPPVELPPPALSASLRDVPDDLPVREPLAVVSTAQPPAALVEEPEDTRPKVQGFLCSRGHLNDPRGLFCNLCGIRMAERTGVFVEGVRPPLGLLVFDNGATVSLDTDYLLGREPETDDRVLTGHVRPLLVIDQTGGVSRHHAEIRLAGWDVLLLDIGSANGTLVALPGAQAWSSLVPNQPVRLFPGMAVRMGGRQFSFESPHGGR